MRVIEIFRFNMRNKILIMLLTGACGSGKSHFVNILKNRFKNLKVRIHDFDEKMKLTNEAAVEYFLELAIKYNKEGNTLILCGGITPLDLKKSNKYSNEMVIKACLLKVQHNERKARLELREDNFFKAVNTQNLEKEDFIEAVCRNSVMYDELIKHADSYIEIDNTLKNNRVTNKKINYWILRNLKEIKP